MLALIAIPFVFFFLIASLLYLPPVQKWAVGMAVEYASEATGLDVSIGHLSLRFPLDIQLDNISVCKKNNDQTEQNDTILSVERAICNVDFHSILDGRIGIDILQFDNAGVNTAEYIPDSRIKGRVGYALLTCEAIDFKNDSILLDKIQLSNASFEVCLSDTAKQDTTTSETPWVVTFNDINVSKTGVAVVLPGDTLTVRAGIGNLNVSDGLLDLKKGIYSIDVFTVNNSDVKYDNLAYTPTNQLDYNHLLIKELNVGVKSIYYSEDSLSLSVSAGNFVEKSGLRLSELSGQIGMSGNCLIANDLIASTPYSSLSGNLIFDMNTFSSESHGQMNLMMECSIGKDDIALVSANVLEEDIIRQLPKHANFIAKAHGNSEHIKVENLSFDIYNMFSGHIIGDVTNIADMKRMAANFNLEINETQGGSINGNIDYKPNICYNANLSLQNIALKRYIPIANIGPLSANISIKGQGYDLNSTNTDFSIDANISKLKYAGDDFSGSAMQCRFTDGILFADITSTAAHAQGNVSFEGMLSQNNTSATFGINLSNLDLNFFDIVDSPFKIGACGHIDIDSDFKNNHALYGHMSNLCITDSAQTYHPDDIELNILAHADTTDIDVVCGDFTLCANANVGYISLMEVYSTLSEEINRQWTERTIDEANLRRKLPTATLYMKTGHENPFARFMSYIGYGFSSAYIDMKTSPVAGINGTLSVDTLNTNGILLDKISANLISDTDKISYNISIANGQDNPQYSFAALLKGEVINDGTTCTLTIDDKNGMRGIDIGLSAVVEAEHIGLTFHDRPQILGYKEFIPNKNNAIRIGKGMRLSSDVMLVADDGVGFRLYTNDANVDALQDLTLSVYKLDLASIFSILPYTPNVKGVLNGDFHAIVDKESTSISSNIDVSNLSYENSPIGNISTEIVYMPHSDGSHYVDGIIYKKDKEIATLSGTYVFGEEDYIDAKLMLKDMPVDVINGFVPDKILGMRGYGNGELNVVGNVSKPKINGILNLEEASFISLPYGIELKIDDDAVRIEDSRIYFDKFQFYDNASNPLIMNGSLDFSDFEHIWANLTVGGKNILIIDAKENKYSEAYGKAYVNLFSNIKGELSRLNVKAKLDVLPTTNLYYILRDSPLTTDNRLKELVTFTDFNDSIPVSKMLPTVEGVDVDLSIGIHDGAHITCWLNSNHSNYLDIIGNGDLRMQYSQEKMLLTGRYTISSGEMKYSLPIIPLKTFVISEDSYLDFTGDMMNPRMNITATEKVRTSVNDNNGSRMVEFDCGVKLTKTLQDMGLEFLISAPEDNSVSDALNTLSLEERGKLAVTMLTTGMYLNENSSSNITMNSALSAFLQQEINNIAGSALRTLDLSVGLENNTLADGTMSMDYSFKFAKRFWNNRVSVSIGGKISSKPQSSGRSNSFFDNIEMQYRLSDTSNQYLRLFYKHDVYDYLEGYLDQYGAGYVWKRKLQNFKDIFNFKSSNMPIIPVRRDSIVVNYNKTTQNK